MSSAGSKRLTFWIGWLAGVAVCALLLAPVDTDELFYASYGQAVSGALDELGRPGNVVGLSAETPRALRLRNITLDPEFVERSIQADPTLRRAGQLAPDPERGIDPEREIRLRTRTALMAWNDGTSAEGSSFHPIYWHDAEIPEEARANLIEGTLTIRPRVAIGPWPRIVPGESGCQLQLALDESPTMTAGRSFVGEGSHGWPTRDALIPPIVAILLAVAFKRTILALGVGVLAGAFLLQSASQWSALTHVAQAFGEDAISWIPESLHPAAATVVHFGRDIVYGDVLTDLFRIEIIGFVVFLCMAIGVMSRAGGIQGLVNALSRLAVGPRSTQLVTYISGILVFFDDYSNCIIVGNTMRPLSDAKGVSREKLSYIVDSTAAPIAAVAVLSTWVAYEISTFSGQLSQASATLSENDGFRIFLATIPYRFYCFFTLVFVFLTIVMRREFGPMLDAERRAHHLGQPIAPGATPMVSGEFARVDMKPGMHPRAWNALLPVLTLIGVTIFGIWYTGKENAEGTVGWFAYLRAILEGANSTRAIFWGSIAAFLLAALLALSQSLLSVMEVLSAAWSSARALFFAVIILVLAWSIGIVCDHLETATYLTALSRPLIRPELLPTVLFLTSCLVAFATGSSWSTMAILLPNVVVLAWTLGETPGSLGGMTLLVLSIGAVLEGSIFGDHCSPISDTTVLSSVATASDHLDHVRTQAPYAMTTMAITLLVGYVPVAFFGVNPYVCMGLGVIVLLLLMLMCGRNPADPLPSPSSALPSRSTPLDPHA